MHCQQNHLSSASFPAWGFAGLDCTIVSERRKLSGHHVVNALEATVGEAILMKTESIKCGKDFLLECACSFQKLNWIKHMEGLCTVPFGRSSETQRWGLFSSFTSFMQPMGTLEPATSDCSGEKKKVHLCVESRLCTFSPWVSVSRSVK
jgi:hypothetical protein